MQIKNLNQKWENGGTHVLCQCFDVVFVHSNMSSGSSDGDDKVRINAGMLCNALVGHDTPTAKISDENDPYYYGDFFKSSELVHVNYDQRVFDWKQKNKQMSESASSSSQKKKKPLPDSVQEMIQKKEIPAICFCGETKAVLKGDRMASTVCLCSLCRSRTSTGDCSVIFPESSLQYDVEDQLEAQKWARNPDQVMTAYNCKSCGTCMEARFDGISVFSTNALLKGLVGDNNPADYDWGNDNNSPLHGPPSLVGDFMYMFYANRAVNMYGDDMQKWTDIPAPFGGIGGQLDAKGNPLADEKKEKNEE